MKISHKIAGWLALSSMLMFTPAVFADDQDELMDDEGIIDEQLMTPDDDQFMIPEEDVALRVRVNAGWGGRNRWRGGGYYYRPYYRSYQPYYYGPGNYYYYRW